MTRSPTPEAEHQARLGIVPFICGLALGAFIGWMVWGWR